MWIKPSIHSIWLTGRHPDPLFHINTVLLSCSSDVDPGRHWNFFFRPSKQRGVTLIWNANLATDMEQLRATLTGKTPSMFDTANLMIGRQDQSLNESVAVSTT
jgi:hypothetical protein